MQYMSMAVINYNVVHVCQRGVEGHVCAKFTFQSYVTKLAHNRREN